MIFPGRDPPVRFGGEEAVLFRNVFPATPSGKVELASSYLEKKYGGRLPTFRPVASRYPLALLSPASDQRITSTFGGVAEREGPPPLEMHPDDARARGLHDGQRVRVWNELGEVRLPLRVTTRVPGGRGVLAQGRVAAHERQRPDGLGALPRPPRGRRRRRLLQRRPGGGGRASRTPEES